MNRLSSIDETLDVWFQYIQRCIALVSWTQFYKIRIKKQFTVNVRCTYGEACANFTISFFSNLVCVICSFSIEFPIGIQCVLIKKIIWFPRNKCKEYLQVKKVEIVNFQGGSTARSFAMFCSNFMNRKRRLIDNYLKWIRNVPLWKVRRNWMRN